MEVSFQDRPAHDEADRFFFEMSRPEFQEDSRPDPINHQTRERPSAVPSNGSHQQDLPPKTAKIKNPAEGMDEIIFSTKAAIKHLIVHANVTLSGCIAPTEKDIIFVSREGAIGQVIKFRYDFVGGDRVFIEVAPSLETNSAEIRIHDDSIFDEKISSWWLRHLNIV